MSTALSGDDIGEMSLMVKAKAMMELRATVRSRVQTQFLNGQALAQANDYQNLEEVDMTNLDESAMFLH